VAVSLLAVADRLVTLLQVGAALWALTRILTIVQQFAPRPPQPRPVPVPEVPLSPAARHWIESWPEGWERAQADGALREMMQVTRDWDKAVARMPTDT
jgi:hypothetical protein